MQRVSIGKITLIGLFPLMYSVIVFLSSLFNSMPEDINKNGLRLFLSGLGQMSVGSIHFLIQIKGKGSFYRKITQNQSRLMRKMYKNVFKVQNVPQYKRQVVLTYLGLFCLTLLDIISPLLYYLFHNGFESGLATELSCFPILICNFLVCFCFLKITFYKHHYLSFSLIIISHMIVVIADYFANSQFILEGYWERLAIYAVVPFVNCTYEIFLKVIMENKYIEPFKLLFFQGLFTVMIFFVLCLFWLIPTEVMALKWFFQQMMIFNDDFFSNFTWRNVGFAFGYMVIGSLNQLLVVLIISLYNPTTRIVAYFMASLFNWVYAAITTQMSASYVVIGVIGSACIVVAGLIYHEMIILHCFSLEENTREQISLRSKREIAEELNAIEGDEIDNDEGEN